MKTKSRSYIAREIQTEYLNVLFADKIISRILIFNFIS